MILVIGNKDFFINTTKNSNVTVEEKELISIEDITVDKKDLKLNPVEGKWYYKNVPFNGFATKIYNNGIVEEKLGFYKGKREGVAKRWSDKGVLRVESNYHENKLVGLYRSWWENGALAEESFYIKGFKDGEEKQWYPDGQLSKFRNLVKGNESGMQKAWLKNGTLYVNYEAKNGRIFGLLRANLCYQLEDEKVITE
ncbi:hypothetical protein H0I23_06485 [Cellulophaga sp. HaHaR_3_176]|nr:hypothetical protein H0I23_06485 [Cellulophaga sp. HaHaR_3_176]